MKISDKKGVQLLIKMLHQCGIENVVLSPGSRNAPISLSFAHHPDFKVRVIADERVAAYHAIGISLHTKMPTVICCTSGTAVLNYGPAIAEAYYQHIPLIVITADRPKEWIDQGDGQTIRQENVFSNYILQSMVFNGEVANVYDSLVIEDIIRTAILKSGPVHINVSLEEPLYKLTDISYENDLTDRLKIETVFEREKLDEIVKLFDPSKKLLIIAGQMQRDEGSDQILNKYANDKNAVVLTECTSNLFFENYISCIDRTIDGFSEEDKENFKPDILITIGNAILSKKVKTWLRKYQPSYHIKIGSYDKEMDTFKCKTHSVDISIIGFFYLMLKGKISNRDYKESWMELNEQKAAKHHTFISSCDFSDLKVFSVLMNNIPSETLLHLGNSSPIRYAQLFDVRKDLVYFSNRGVSGIDGCTSTAAGMADVSKQTVTLISGDISFFYDTNAFWNNYLKNLKVIVINNGGGGIFRIIDQPENMNDTELLFETRHQRKAEGVAKTFGIRYFSATDESSLTNGINELYKDNLPGILEIFTPTEKNPLILKNYFDYLKNK